MNALEGIIREIIAAQGDISVATYMELALQHPLHGYYRTREPLGREGDFITAPEVSQMFGEMIGVWCAEAWRSLGRPDPVALVELGPGRGTMMRDVLRATEHVSGFHAAKYLYLIDSDKILREKQRDILADANPRHVDVVSQLPPMPALILANEFFDALPVRQFEKTFRGWAERMVTVSSKGLVMTQRLLGVEEMNLISPDRHDVAPGTVFETSPKAETIMRKIAAHLAAHGGAMLVVDYGFMAPSGAATLQAVSKHAYADLFERPGEIDLTAHVDFVALARAAHDGGSQASAAIGQGEFLKNLGIDIRADMLKKRATLPQNAAIDAELRRLIDEDQMGSLFKVMEVRPG